MKIVGISGSPAARSRSAWLLQLAQTRLEGLASDSRSVAVRALPAQALLWADKHQPELQQALRDVVAADVVLVSTPVYKAAYSGLLKVFLDLLPTDALAGKTVLPMASGGGPAHLLAIDYALRPLLAALGARHVLNSVYANDSQLVPHESGGYVPSPELVSRLDAALRPLLGAESAELARCRA